MRAMLRCVTRHRKASSGISQLQIDEDVAAAIVSISSGVTACRSDFRGGPNGQVDFKLFDGAVCVGALEITSVVNRSMNMTIAGVTKGSGFTLPDSNLYWVVSYDGDRARTRRLQNRLVPILEGLESSERVDAPGPTRFSVVDPGSRRMFGSLLPEDINDELHAIGIQAISAMLPDDPEGRGTVHWAVVGGVVPASAAETMAAVDAELAKRDNRKKLATAVQSGRAELFVWLDAPEYRITTFHIADPFMSRFEGPLARPTLPDEISAVWIAPSTLGATSGSYWFSAGGPWAEGTWALPDGYDIHQATNC